MAGMFNDCNFRSDISKWDVSKVKNMSFMFNRTGANRLGFDGDISNWDVSSVEDMNSMFCESNFNADISKWNVCNLKNIIGRIESIRKSNAPMMFEKSKLNLK
jgi:surface protein